MAGKKDKDKTTPEAQCFVVLTERRPFWDGAPRAAGELIAGRPADPAIRAMLARGWIKEREE